MNMKKNCLTRMYVRDIFTYLGPVSAKSEGVGTERETSWTAQSKVPEQLVSCAVMFFN